MLESSSSLLRLDIVASSLSFAGFFRVRTGRFWPAETLKEITISKQQYTVFPHIVSAFE